LRLELLIKILFKILENFSGNDIAVVAIIASRNSRLLTARVGIHWLARSVRWSQSLTLVWHDVCKVLFDIQCQRPIRTNRDRFIARRIQ
jgi:hypothetical protein